MDRKQYYAIKNTLIPAEKALINFYELQWTLKKNVPTVEEVFEYLKKTRPNLKITTVNYYINRAPVVAALDRRGIPWRQHSREDLTPTQVAAAITMMNFADTRPNDEKLEQLGINPTQYYAWLNDPQFKNLIDSLADQNLTNIRPTAIGEFTKAINKGDWNAVKYFLDVTGELKQDTGPNPETLILMLIEIIQKHVKDPEIITAIAQDIKLAAANRTLEVVMQPQITSYVVPDDDPELELAKKKLGIG